MHALALECTLEVCAIIIGVKQMVSQFGFWCYMQKNDSENCKFDGHTVSRFLLRWGSCGSCQSQHEKRVHRKSGTDREGGRLCLLQEMKNISYIVFRTFNLEATFD